MMLFRFRFVAFACGFLSAGCSVFQEYPAQTQAARDAFAQGNFERALAAYEAEETERRDALVFALEKGLVAQAGGDFPRSIKEFENAYQLIDQFESEAAVTTESTLEAAGAILINEKTLPYEGEGFEKILLHTLSAFNYLCLGEIDEAGVEVRRTYQRLKEERERHEETLEKARSEAGDSPLDVGDITKQVDELYEEVARPPFLASEEAVYQNPFATYVSALLYEEMGLYNDAYIDLKTLYGLVPQFSYLRDDLPRVAKLSGFQEDTQSWIQKLGPPPKPEKTAQGEVFLLAGLGWGPQKVETSLVLPVPDPVDSQRFHLIKLAFPKFVPQSDPGESFALASRGKRQATSQPLMDVEATAARYLEDRMVVLAIRQAVRAIAKLGVATAVTETAEEAGGEGLGLLAQLATSVWNIASEQADLRGWTTLPRELHVARLRLPAGKQPVTLRLLGRGGGQIAELQVGTLEIPPGKRRFIVARSLGDRIFFHVCPLGPVRP